MSLPLKFVSVAPEAALDRPLDYALPESLGAVVQRGSRVLVPLRNRKVLGYVLELKQESAWPRVLPIEQVLVGEEVPEDLLDLAFWMSSYYCTPMGQILKTILPASVRRGTQQKEQLGVFSKVSKNTLATLCAELRSSNSPQAQVLDVLLQTKKDLLLSEVLERAQCSRSPITSLVKKGILGLQPLHLERSPLKEVPYFPSAPKRLNEEQAGALEKIDATLQQNRFETHLLFGVTGSGKTEVYLQAIEKALALNKGVIVLIPEISLTPQTIERFRSRLPNCLAILHHRLSDGERYDEWSRIRSGKASVVIGARSAVFSPVPRLGLIIVDEEHEQSYKQTDMMPCYHARNIAVVRGKMSHSCVILGSATPSLESYYNTQSGKYTLTVLSTRANKASLPQVALIDMRREYEKAKRRVTFSDPLIAAIEKRVNQGEQTILFLNRRGYHTSYQCQLCEQALSCISCAIPLTFHAHTNSLNCHMCGYIQTPPPKKCPACAGETLKFQGIGTEWVEKALLAILPGVRTIRMDGDSTRHKGSQEKFFKAFRTGKADVLIGTQMVAKGLHFPAVTLVGILNGDAALHHPDFRAAEYAFQLITQVSGRAGRGPIAGEVLLQTALPEQATIVLASQQDYPSFFQAEVPMRKLFGYPPFCHLVKLVFSGLNEQETEAYALQFCATLRTKLSMSFPMLPVVPSGHTKIREKYRFQCLIKGNSVLPINQAILQTQQMLSTKNKIRLHIDVDPTSTFY